MALADLRAWRAAIEAVRRAPKGEKQQRRARLERLVAEILRREVGW